MKLIPQPQQLELQEGTYRIGYQDRITLDAACSPAAYGYAKLLAGELEEQAGISLLIDRRTHTTHPGIRLLQAERPRLGREGYELEITPAGVRITGGGEAGLLYGVQTLRQILRQEGLVLPCLHLTDRPALATRGLFYDVTRGRIPTIVKRVNTVVTTGDVVDVVVTDQGIAVNPRRPDVKEKLEKAGLHVFTIQQLQQRAEKIVGVPDPIRYKDRIVGVVMYRDNTIIDVVRQIDEDE